MPGWETALIAAAGCAAFWFAILHLISRSFGWHQLARHYRLSRPFTGRRRWFCRGYVGPAHYGNGLILGADGDGLYVAVIPFFRPGHPPLFVPWADVTARPTGWLLWRFVEFRFARIPVTVSVLESTGKAVVADAARAGAEPFTPHTPPRNSP